MEVEEKSGAQYARAVIEVRKNLEDFLHQKTLLSRPYSKTGTQEYEYSIFDADEAHPRKIINQRLFDMAARDGFPPGFFRDSYFDCVTIYCLPDGQDCANSIFQSCTFAVCRISGATFEAASLYNSEFHSCDLTDVSFFRTIIAHTHFHDCHIKNNSFHQARMKSCNTIDCELNGVDYGGAILDGCTFGRVAANAINGLDTATITQGGATNEECRRNRDAVLRELRPAKNTPKRRQPKARAGR